MAATLEMENGENLFSPEEEEDVAMSSVVSKVRSVYRLDKVCMSLCITSKFTFHFALCQPDASITM